jgi:hypothetical protein
MNIVTEPDPSKNPPKSIAFELGLIVAAGISVMGLVVWWATADRDPTLEPSKPTPGRSSGAKSEHQTLVESLVGDRACRECHPGECALHSRSGHSKTLRIGAAHNPVGRLAGAKFNDPEQKGVVWSYSVQGDKLAVERIENGKSDKFPIDFAFGSGHSGVTFVSLHMPTGRLGEYVDIEHRVSYYANRNNFGITPGQEKAEKAEGLTPAGRLLPNDEVKSCFACHTTINSTRGQEIVDAATMIPGIGCERCHGPGEEHVRLAREGKVSIDHFDDRPKSTAAEEMLLCGQCHRHPDVISSKEIVPENAKIVRFQPVGLMQSKCYVKSEGNLRCSTCHDPHARASTNTAEYEQTCLSCHSGGEAKSKPCSIDPRPIKGCVLCHMPKRDAMHGLMYTDHWIRVRRDGADEPKPSDASTDRRFAPAEIHKIDPAIASFLSGRK